MKILGCKDTKNFELKTIFQKNILIPFTKVNNPRD